MTRRKRVKKGKMGPSGYLFITVFVVMAFSLSVRWSGMGRSLSGEDESFQVEVLNGTGEPGMARKVTIELRKIGIDVLIEGNAGRFDFKESLLIDRRGNPALMRKLARRLGCRRVLLQIEDHPKVDVTFIIGWDREKLKIGDG